MAEDLAADEIRAPLKLEHHATLPQQSECSRWSPCLIRL